MEKLLRWLGVLVVLFVLGAAREAQAAPRTHDGFQFRGVIGGGYLSDSESFEYAGQHHEAKVKGGAALIEFYFGGSPLPGLTFGGFLSGMVAPGPKVELEGVSYEADDDQSLNFAQLGPYVDFYPNPQGGFHLMGSITFAQVSASNDGDQVDSSKSDGLGLGLGLGYDAWIASEWNLGVLGRFTYAHTSHDTSGIDVTDNALAPAILLSVSYH